jgi:glycosyltransferase involved in cell wall biosynthesis
MKIAITGSRGIPNNYGGFEQCAENLAVLLANEGHDVSVYNPHYHNFNESTFHGVKIIKRYNPEKKIGTLGNFIYDYLCMTHAIKNKCNVLLVLGYTTSSIFYPILNKNQSILITNMDGLEWKRDKWNSFVKKCAKWFEKLGALYSDFLISDNREIQNYILEEYNKDSTFIPYGAELFNDPNKDILTEYNLEPYHYDMLIARLEKENNIEVILDGIIASKSTITFLVIGNHQTKYGEYLKHKYSSYPTIIFYGGIYNMNHLNNLRWFCRFYFHGHSVGGTNPSLLEAMASGAFILAHDNKFNRDVLQENSFYFKNSAEVSNLVNTHIDLEKYRNIYIEANFEKIKNQYNWHIVAKEYETLFNSVTTEPQK